MVKVLQSLAVTACMKSLLLTFNMLLWVSGVMIFVGGIWIQCELTKYFELTTVIPVISPYVLIATGAVMIIISSLACCCTIKGQPALLYMYGAFLAVVFMLEVGVALTTFSQRGQIMSGFYQGLNQSMVQYQNGSKEKIATYDLLQTSLHCCGVQGPNDWGNLHPPVPVPLSCCKEENTNCDVANEDAIYDDGCYYEILRYLNVTMGIILSAGITSTIIPLGGLTMACCLAHHINKAKYEPMA